MGDRENKKILLVDIKKYRITEKLKDACISMGFEKSNIFVTSGYYRRSPQYTMFCRG